MKTKKVTMIAIVGQPHPNPDSLYRVTFARFNRARVYSVTEARVRLLLQTTHFEYIATDGTISLVAFPRRVELTKPIPEQRSAGEGIIWGLLPEFSSMTLEQERDARFEDYLDEPASYKCNGVY